MAYSTRPCDGSFPQRSNWVKNLGLILYQRDDCHLCDQALAVLAQARAPEFESVFIDEQPELEALYGLRVPVLRHLEAGVELGWPFDPADVEAFIAGCMPA